MIEYALRNRVAAAENLQSALQINPSFDLLQSDAARKTLEEL